MEVDGGTSYVVRHTWGPPGPLLFPCVSRSSAAPALRIQRGPNISTACELARCGGPVSADRRPGRSSADCGAGALPAATPPLTCSLTGGLRSARITMPERAGRRFYRHASFGISVSL
ncbi:hypothetical protein NDU88_001108 [Pleurodeles waltl]|uniref:Uncharacterized protein n=1 Tax=Pleurodeles waltl TaxID=8319 RepID=A0AAV7LC64_PLEWA|nr:hypothetical protein NDU88_001108 [Pleurodeles waltl]